MLKQKDNENKWKKIWRFFTLESNYASYEAYQRDMWRCYCYVLLSVTGIFLFAHFNVGFLVFFSFCSVFSFVCVSVFFNENYRENAPKIWKVQRVYSLVEGHPVYYDEGKNQLIFHEKTRYSNRESFDNFSSSQPAFRISTLSLGENVLVDLSSKKQACLVKEAFVYEEEGFEREFRRTTKGKCQALIRYVVYTDELIQR